jgi:hypothetical protein
VNDANAVIDGSSPDSGTTFAAEYLSLLERTVSVPPSVRLVLGEPSYLPTSPAEALREAWAAAPRTRAESVRELPTISALLWCRTKPR